MNYLSQFSKPFLQRFWHRPLDAVPIYRCSSDFVINTVSESGALFDEVVPASVNGFRIAGVTLIGTVITNQIQPTSLRVRIYAAEVRFPGPTLNIPTRYDELFLCGATPYRTEVCWLLLPGCHWQATIYNPFGVGTNHSALSLDGWYF